MGLAIGRIERLRPSEGGDGVVQPSQIVQRAAEPELGCRIVGRGRGSGLERRQRRLRLAAQTQQAAEQAAGVDQLRIERDRAAASRDRVVEAILILQHFGAVVVQPRIVGRERERRAQRGFGFIERAELRQCAAQAAMRRGVIGRRRGRASERRRRFGRLAGLEKRLTGIERGRDQILAQRRIVGPQRQRLLERDRGLGVSSQHGERDPEIGVGREVVGRQRQRLSVQRDRSIEPSGLVVLQRGIEEFRGATA